MSGCGAAARGTRSSRGTRLARGDAPAVGRRPRRRRRPCRGDAPASARRSRCPRSSAARASPAASLPGWTRACRVRLEHGAEIGRGCDGCPHLGLVETHDAVLAAGRGILRPLVEPLELVRLGRHREGCRRAPTRRRSRMSAMSAPIASRFAMPRRSSRSISSGQRLRPLSRPWVRLASQNPPLRPDAAQPTVRASTRTMRASGSRRCASSAVHSPV